MCSMHCNKVTTIHANVYHYKKHTLSRTLVFKHSPWLHWNNQQCTLDLVKLVCGWFVNETQLFVNRPRERNIQSLSVCSQTALCPKHCHINQPEELPGVSSSKINTVQQSAVPPYTVCHMCTMCWKRSTGILKSTLRWTGSHLRSRRRALDPSSAF